MPRSRVSISRRPPSIARHQVDVPAVYGGAFIITKHNFVVINVFSGFSLLAAATLSLPPSSSMNCLRIVVHSGSSCLGESSKTEALYILPPTSTGRKEPHTREELLAATRSTNTTIDNNQFKSYTNKFKYLGSLLEKQMDDVATPDTTVRLNSTLFGFNGAAEIFRSHASQHQK